MPHGSAPLVGGLAGPVGEERADGVLEVLGVEQRAGDLADDRVGRAGAALLLGATIALVAACASVGPLAILRGERARLLLERVVGQTRLTTFQRSSVAASKSSPV